MTTPIAKEATIQRTTPRGKGSSIFEMDVVGRDDLRYWGKKLTDPVDTLNDKWRLIPAFLKTKGLVKQHIDSFNYFVDVDMKQIVYANRLVRSEVDPNFILKFKDIRVGTPTFHDSQIGTNVKMYPQDCRLRDCTYAAPIKVDIVYSRGGDATVKRDVHLGYLPIMLRSSRCHLTGKSPEGMVSMRECPLDPGGYFIINGTEKVILIQEQLSKNRIIVESSREGEITASVTSSTAEKKSKTNVTYAKGNKIVMRSNSFKVDLPITIVMKALGVTSDKEIAELVCGLDEEFLELFGPSLEIAAKEQVFTQRQALEWLGQRCKPPLRPMGTFGPTVRRPAWEEAREVLFTTVLAHIPIDGPQVINKKGKHVPLVQLRPKAVYCAIMVRRVLQAVKDGGVTDDRDFVGNKRLELAGSMMSILFEDLFKSFQSSLRRQIDSSLKKRNKTGPPDPALAVAQCSSNITDGFRRSISSGNWNIARFNMRRAGVTHVLSRLSYVSALGMMSRMSSQFEKSRKVSGPRSLQTSQWGMICPSDTPEGEGCGLIKNLALTAHVTTDTDEEPLRALAFYLGVTDISFISGRELNSSSGGFMVFLNGVLLGLHPDPITFVEQLRSLRRKGRIGAFVSVYKTVSQRMVHISTDGGRVCRPLIIVEKGVPKIGAKEIKEVMDGLKSFEDLWKEGKIEYLDVNEETDANIAVYEKDIHYDSDLEKLQRSLISSRSEAHHQTHNSNSLRSSKANSTHLEIEPFTVLGAVAALIPYPHHNQSPRNTYQCAMGKQAIGAIAYNQYNRIDTLLYLMVYPQQPMVKSRSIELIGYDKVPAGQNATVAVMSYSGYDIEDALVINKASLDRGFGRCQVLRKYVTQIRQYPNSTYDMLVSPETLNNGGNGEKATIVDPDGLPGVGSRVFTGDMIVSKMSPTDTLLRSNASQDPGKIEYKPAGMKYKKPGDGVIDQVVITTNQEDQTVVKVNIRETRRPELGDKFSSRHGQKGVCGIIVNAEDMPFTDLGVMPDIIMNPHGFPSRMTVGKMIELLSGKAGVLDGSLQYGTAFGGSKVEDMSRILIANGFNYSGKDYVTSGITGEPLQAYIFYGPIYYQKLKHMVMDKMHARAQGPRAVLTRQPTEGRSRDGGLRVGEMERDCLIGHGTSSLLMERLLFSSDKFQMDVCQDCGLIGWQGYCGYCKKRVGVVSVTVPYAAKLLFQELISMNVVPKLKVADWDAGK